MMDYVEFRILYRPLKACLADAGLTEEAMFRRLRTRSMRWPGSFVRADQVAAARDLSLFVRQRDRQANNDTDGNYSRPLFECMPSLGDEAVWNLLKMMHGLIDAYEEHYAVPLQRFRN